MKFEKECNATVAVINNAGETCQTCMYVYSNRLRYSFFCHRNPPTIIARGTVHDHELPGHFPMVSPWSRCGEYRPGRNYIASIEADGYLFSVEMFDDPNRTYFNLTVEQEPGVGWHGYADTLASGLSAVENLAFDAGVRSGVAMAQFSHLLLELSGKSRRAGKIKDAVRRESEREVRP